MEEKCNLVRGLSGFLQRFMLSDFQVDLIFDLEFAVVNHLISNLMLVHYLSNLKHETLVQLQALLVLNLL